MATGFIDRLSNRPTRGRIRTAFDKLINLGADYTDMLIRNSNAVGPIQHSQGNFVLSDSMMYDAIKMADLNTNSNRVTPFHDKNYRERIEELRIFSMNHEIENVLNTIADEAIVYDAENFFCYPEYGRILGYIDRKKQEKIQEELDSAFRQVYSAWNFSDGMAWHWFYQWLIDGYLAFEIIYDDQFKNIIGFQYIEPWSLEPAIFTTKSGKTQIGWIQYSDSSKDRRELPDEKVIIISYKKDNVTGRNSYVERLVRPFNLLRNIEHSMVIWRIMNSSFRMKFVVPTGTKSRSEWSQTIGQVMALYKEEITIDSDSGEIAINGIPGMQFYKNYILPSKGGEQIAIDTVAGQGPDMNDPSAVKWFRDKFIQATQIPYGRFNSEAPSTFMVGAEGISREEQAFSKFINRLRSLFQDIIVKPFKIQFFLNNPEFMNDMIFNTNMGVLFNKDNLFEEMKRIDVANKQIQLVNTLRSYMGMDDKPMFHAEFLIENIMSSTFNADDLKRNAQYFNLDEDNAPEVSGGSDASGGAAGGMPPPNPGGAPPPPSPGAEAPPPA